VQLQDYFSTLKRYWALLLVTTLLGGLASYAYSQTVEPTYRSQADIMVVPTRGETPAELAQGANYVSSLAQTYALLAVSPEVLDPVIDELELEVTARQLAKTVEVQVPLDTLVIQIRVTDTDPGRARVVADAIADQLGSTIPRVSPSDRDDQPSVHITTIAAASIPQHPVSPDLRKNGLIGTAVGFVIGVAVALYRRHHISRIDDADEVAAVTDAGVLGELPAAGAKRDLVRALRTSPRGRVAEAMRQLAANLRFINLGGRRRVLMLTSGSSGEGKTSVSLGLALTLAETGYSVLYLEADLRRPGSAEYTGLETSVGVTDVLVGDTTIEDAAQQWGHPNLSVLASGAVPPNPGKIVASEEFGALISDARSMYSYVIVDSPPILAVSDALWLSASVDGTLLVVRAGKTKAVDLRRSLEALERAEQPVIGITLTGAKIGHRSPYFVEDDDRNAPS